MLSNQVVSYEERRNCQEEAFNYIESCYKKLVTLEKYFKATSCQEPSQPYANFRDALFHFRKICETQSLLQINGNMYTLQEHLLRSVKDMMVSLTIFLTEWMEHFFVIHAPDEVFRGVIEDTFPFMSRISDWNVVKFRNVIQEMSKADPSIDEAGLKRKFLYYCVEVVQQDPKCILELRKHSHIIKNHNHKLRSSSSILAKPYSDDNEFQTFCDDINNFMSYTLSVNIHHCMYFMDNLMDET